MLTKNQTTDEGDPLLFWLEVGEEGLDEILEQHGIVPCHLHRNLATDKLKQQALPWVQSIVKELAEEMESNN